MTGPVADCYLGIDPGKSGAIAVVGPIGNFVDVVKLSETQHDVWAWLDQAKRFVSFAVIEKVHSSPQMGVKSAFTFGENFGFCQGMLVSSSIRFEFASPQKWMKAMGCMTKGDKNVTKSRAQGLFPDVKITHAIADALLIADYARRIRQPD